LFEAKQSVAQPATALTKPESPHASDRSETGPFSLELAPGTTELKRDCVGREVLLGIRPEHVREASAASETARTNLVQGLLELVEPLGPETFVHVRRGAALFTARIGPGAQAALNTKVTLAFDMRSAHLFDLKTGERI